MIISATERIKKILDGKEGFKKPSFLFLFIFISDFIFASKDWNLILISIDTLRYDYLSIVNPENVSTPNLDDFAKKSIFFEYAFTTCPLTSPAHASLFTGLYPKDHGIRENLSGKLKTDIKTLAEVLKENGFKTYAFVSSSTLSRDYGFSKGFDVFDDNFSPCSKFKKCFLSERAGIDTISSLKQKVSLNSKIFLFLHIFEPHFPYEPPEPYKSKYKNNLYAGEVAYSDFLIGEFLIYLKEKGLFKNSIICIFSDHGEGLYEYNEPTHGYLAYNSTLRVPLMLYYPDCKFEKKSYPVSLIDLFPTFLDLLEIKRIKNLSGQNLLYKEEREIFFESLYPYFYFGTNEILGLIKYPYKFIYKKNVELFDIYKDPKEKIKIQDRDKIKNFKSILNKDYSFKKEKISPLDEEREKKLSSLGYLKGADLSKIKQKDPDEAMEVLAKLEKARAEYLFGDLNISLNLYNDLLEEFPSSSVILDERGLILYSLGRKEEARKSFEMSLKYFPGNFNALINLANFYSQEGKFKEAIGYYEKASTLKPQDPDLLFNYAATCANSGNKKKAKELFKKYLELYPDEPEREKIEEYLKKE